MSAACVFCRIIAGEIPSMRVYEDASIVAFLDIAPLAPGHLLVVPRVHVTTLFEMTESQVSTVAAQLPRLAKAVLRVTGASGLNVLQNNGRSAGQVVEHVHFHLIPRVESDGLGFRWNAGSYPPGRAEDVQRRLVAELSDRSQTG
ncbi:MAG: HIT family protein [Phycisphaerae bacterium]|nr:HIT family protein [Phycisphaerae bacterium]